MLLDEDFFFWTFLSQFLRESKFIKSRIGLDFQNNQNNFTLLIHITSLWVSSIILISNQNVVFKDTKFSQIFTRTGIET